MPGGGEDKRGTNTASAQSVETPVDSDQTVETEEKKESDS